ncbi:MAG: DUF6152 family protein [Gammaproteobacteria bacterium]|jgi:hypothetical protein|nr:DUF6152 family protein [Gammaproteobacteria bacterium]
MYRDRNNSSIASQLAFLALVLAYLPAGAHHSGGMFDAEQTVELTGTVKEFQWTNPHIWIQVIVPGADDAAVEWSIEGGVPNRLFRAGWRPTSFEPGDEVTILAHPMRDGGKAGSFVGAKLADGSTLGRFSP